MRARSLIVVLALFVAPVRAESWSAVEVVVHEWGVEIFDWDSGRRVEVDLPPFIYTPERPGLPIPDARRVRRLPPDSGVRAKPILYFHGAESFGPSIPISVEVSFTEGAAICWWPQVHAWRSPREVLRADRSAHDAWLRRFSGQQWRKDDPGIPDDPTVELAWSWLDVTKDAPAGVARSGLDLPADHWVQRSRDVDAWYVSNGREAERYLFYEGRTREVPAVSLVPCEGGIRVVNTGGDPVHDVFVIRVGPSGRDVHFQARLAPGDLEGLFVPDAVRPLDDASFRTATSDRLLSRLTIPRPVGPGHYEGLRDPTDPQTGPSGQGLYEDEARARAGGGGGGLFGEEGVVLRYRADPAARARALPMSIYTDMFHYVSLARTGLVLNRGVPWDRVQEVSAGFEAWLAAAPGERPALEDRLLGDRFLALGLVRHARLSGRGDPDLDLLESLLLDGRVEEAPGHAAFAAEVRRAIAGLADDDWSAREKSEAFLAAFARADDADADRLLLLERALARSAVAEDAEVAHRVARILAEVRARRREDPAH